MDKRFMGCGTTHGGWMMVMNECVACPEGARPLFIVGSKTDTEYAGNVDFRASYE